MPSPRKAIGGGLYMDESGGYWVRPWVNRKRSWRKLKATARRQAEIEARAKLTDHIRATESGVGKSPFGPAGTTFSDMAALYVAKDCPNKRLEPRPPAFCTTEKTHIESLKKFYARHLLPEIKLATLPQYHAWRTGEVRKGSLGNRMVERELNTLSNVLNYAVSTGHLDFNYIRCGRPRFCRAKDIQPSRHFAPADANEIHRIANYFFQHASSHVMGWLTLFSALTGCRNTELRMLRVDAKTTEHPGYLTDEYLFIRRAKGGVFPYVKISPELADCIECFKAWHEEYAHPNPYFFPAHGGDILPIGPGSFGHALQRACKELEMPPRRPHGFRSFYVTKRRSDGVPDVQIAAEIGDKTVALISQTYGDLPPNWVGMKKLTFLPSEGEPAWAKWRKTPAKDSGNFSEKTA